MWGISILFQFRIVCRHPLACKLFWPGRQQHMPGIQQDVPQIVVINGKHGFRRAMTLRCPVQSLANYTLHFVNPHLLS